MTIELTEAQEKTLGKSVRFSCIVAPSTHEEFVLVPRKEFEALKGDLDEQREMDGLLKMSLRNVIARMEEEA
ncbi:MAG TPA: hypothetical protein VKX17_00880 [Planctomycetota bacterium]|nr:hypothetical protein [Planctomycetota bacterium]